MKSKMTKQIGIRLSEEQYALLQKASRETGLDSSIIVRSALLRILEEWQCTNCITFKRTSLPTKESRK